MTWSAIFLKDTSSRKSWKHLHDVIFENSWNIEKSVWIIAWSTVVTNSYNSWEHCVSNDKVKQEICPEVDFSVPSACRVIFSFLNVKSWTNISALLENWKKMSNIKLTVFFVMIDAVGADLKCLIKRAGKPKRKKWRTTRIIHRRVLER